ncbi:hypothetical protein HOA55_01025 [archaeon]|jgi:hypothetical protein|nr:hypothetical protein [archaeon]MBT3577542.1 hypothetical protein [archaeon]MBT6819917.1 hypothetical protein [archaeon]MBT6956673.1 hypothetical protein [archaeon]MBT7025073.1 hypothetical protein [archaeon]
MDKLELLEEDKGLIREANALAIDANLPGLRFSLEIYMGYVHTGNICAKEGYTERYLKYKAAAENAELDLRGFLEDVKGKKRSGKGDGSLWRSWMN